MIPFHSRIVATPITMMIGNIVPSRGFGIYISIVTIFEPRPSFFPQGLNSQSNVFCIFSPVERF
ncbi:hypothetical protein RHGRI_019649 [Rhododendron griersonianum]|uniref:Uncharacterized protein n=1 Tax=Rhododendron griersonianum TaxID=479676 RepID=A0AAV6JIP5_9ERIC|nr:hypothetical protein RHGRI_019649 [Rhododendron griersonianum]